MSDPKSGEVVGPEETSHSVDLGGLPKDAIKAIIEKLNQRSQKVTRVFKNEYEITIHDLKQLMEKVVQEFNACSIISNATNASVVLSKNQRFDFSSWKEFEEFDLSQPQTTKSITFGVTLDVIRGSNETPERYTVQVSVQNNPAFFGIQIGPLGIRPIEGFEVPPAPLVATVNFNNYILGKNLLSTIEEWEESLKRREAPIRKKFRKWSSTIRSSLTFITTLAGIYSCRLPLEQLDFSEPSNIGWFFIFGATLIYVFHSIGSTLSWKIEHQIDRQLPGNNIILTKGDERAVEKLQTKNRKTILKSVAFFVGIILQILCSLAATRIWTFLVDMGFA